MADTNAIYIGNAHLLVVDKLRDSASGGGYQNSATVNYNFKSSAGSSITTGSLSYVSASNGRYEGTIAATHTSGLTENATYYAEITVTVSGTQQAFYRLPVVARYRDSC